MAQQLRELGNPNGINIWAAKPQTPGVLGNNAMAARPPAVIAAPPKFINSLMSAGQELANAAMAPGNALMGNYQPTVDPNAPGGVDPYSGMIPDATNLAGMLTLGAGAAPAEDGALRAGISVMDNPAFRQWFGDSKIVDEHGAPRMAYHGSARSFDAFDMNKAGTGSGTEAENAIFVSTDPATASHYADVQGAGLGENPAVEHGGAVYPVYVKATNPYVSKLKGYNSADFAKEIAKARQLGHDSIMFPYVDYSSERQQIGVFSPEQVKSQFNTGAFNPLDPRILYGLGPLAGAGVGAALQRGNPLTAPPTQPANPLIGQLGT